MNFPISRNQLQNIKNDVEDYVIQYNIDKIVDHTKNTIVAYAYQPSSTPTHLGGISSTKLKFTIPYGWKIPNDLKINNISININPWKTHLEVIIQKLKELFPGVNFEIDPLKTYILIDWS
jgi:hypothetical protein